MLLSRDDPKNNQKLAKITFFGTHDFGAAMLQALIENGQYEIVAVITQPDRPVGRSQEMEKSPVKILAEKYNLNILQPESLKNFQFPVSDFDVSIVCQYGLIIPQSILDLPKKGTINVHTSLLPKYRGASPIQSALINGETETGVTIMLMDEKLDHGPILAQEKISIDPDDTYLTLSDKMIPTAQKLLVETAEKWLKNEIAPVPQNEDEVTLCKTLSRDDGKLDFSKTADELYNLYRGLTPWPGVWTVWNGKRLKLLTIKKSNQTIPVGTVKIENDHILIGCATGSIEAINLQLEGKKSMDVTTFLNGYRTIDGAQLG